MALNSSIQYLPPSRLHMAGSHGGCWSKSGDKSSTMWWHVFWFPWVSSEWPQQRLTIDSTLLGLKDVLTEMNDRNIPFPIGPRLLADLRDSGKEFSKIIHREYSSCRNHKISKTATFQRIWLPGLLHSYPLSTGNCEVHNEIESTDHLKGRTKLTEINQEEVQALGLLAARLRTHRRQNKTSMNVWLDWEYYFWWTVYKEIGLKYCRAR